MGSIFELEAQITSAHIHTYIYQHTKHNNSLSVPTVDYTAHYCGQLFVGFCYNFLGSLQKKHHYVLWFCILVEIKMYMKIL